MIRTVVIAGTPVDTRMGVEYLDKRSAEYCTPVCEPIYRPVTEDCESQTKFQYSDYDTQRRKMDSIFDPAIEDGVQDFFIYCNSLSGVFDFEKYCEEKSQQAGKTIRVYTPLQIYRKIGKQYDRVGLIAAHNLSAYNIEKTLLRADPDLYVVGTGNLLIVHSIEEGLPPAEIMDKCGVKDLVRYIEACGCEVLILGCTHFPYLREELDKICSIPVIDPADEMFSAMTGLR